MAGGTSIQLPLTTLPLNTLTPYLRAHLEVADNTLRWDSWWTGLGFVPVRRERVARAVAEVAGSGSRVGFHWDRVLVGLALVASTSALTRAWMSVLALGAAAVLFVMAPTAQLSVTGKDGHTNRLSVCIRHKLDVDLIAMALEDLAGRHAPRNRPGTPRMDPPEAGTVTT
jgi:hypothetical protein